MNPVETLRRAAALVRERAEQAAPAPWRVDHPQLPNRVHVLTAVGGAVAVTGHGRAAEADAAYIASVHPGLMRLVADWLDSVAERWGEAGRRWEGTHALAIARAYLGEQDGGQR